MQLIHGQTTDRRYFWNVTLEGQSTPTTYRSRCSNATGVRQQFAKRGLKPVSVRAKHG